MEYHIVDNNVYLKLRGNHGKDEYIIVSLNKLDYVIKYDWYLGSNGYPKTYKRMGRPRTLHRFIYSIILGSPIPKWYVIDHINCNKLDNRDENLRLASSQENSFNRSVNKNSLTGYKGITQNKKGTYNISISRDGKKYGFKNIDTLEEAKNMYNILAHEVFGEYAYVNK
jgi:hypothetical protein